MNARGPQCATCPSCEREYSVRHDDRLRQHRLDGRGCPGSLALISRSAQRAGRPAGARAYVPKGRRPWDPAVQQLANGARQQRASRRDVELAGKLLANGALDDRGASIAEARVRYPGYTWAQVGAVVGVTKDVAVSLFRRRCIEAGLR